MARPIFGLSTCPCAEIKSEVQAEINRVMLAIIYREAK